MARPRNISIFDLMQYKFPVTAISSIFHRVTGVALFIYVPFVLYFLGLSLSGPVGYHHFQTVISHPCGSFFLWFFCSVGVFHFLAGVKHLIMDMGAWESMGVARVVSWILMLLGLIEAILLGAWIW